MSPCLICGACVVPVTGCHVSDDPGVCILLKLANYSNVDTRRGCGSGGVSCSRSGSELQWPWVDKFVLCNQCKVELEEIECVLDKLEELHQKATQFQKRISTQIQSAIKRQDGDGQTEVPEHDDGDLIEARRRLLSELELQSEPQSLERLDGDRDKICWNPNSNRPQPVIRLHRIEQQFPTVFTDSTTNITASVQQLPTNTTGTRTENLETEVDQDVYFALDLIKEEPDYSSPPSSSEEQSDAEQIETPNDDLDENVNRARKRRRTRRSKIKLESIKPSREKRVHCKYPKCDFKCMRFALLGNHVQDSHLGGDICGRCGAFFPNQATILAAHVQAHDDEDQADTKLRAWHQKQTMAALATLSTGQTHDKIPDKCPYCQKVFPASSETKRSTIIAHIAAHTKHFKCEVEGCIAEFSWAKSLRSHCIRVHPEMKIPPFRCPFADTDTGCQFISADRSTLRRHVRARHLQHSANKPVDADIPLTSSDTTKKDLGCALFTPSESVQGSRELRVKCNYPECDIRCFTVTQLQLHVGTAHVGDNHCRRCGAFFSGDQAEVELAAHQQIHADEDEAQAKLRALHRKQNLPALGTETTGTETPTLTRNLDKCPYCQKVFSMKAKKDSSIIAHHIAIHTKPHKCRVDGCSASFGCPKTLRAHCITMHPEMKIPAFRCPYADSGCSFTSGYSGSIRGHVSTKHAIGERPTFPCAVTGCGFRAASTGGLKVHVEMVHEKKKDCLCTECGKSYYLPVELRAHMRTHTGEKPFVCGTCGKAFTKKGPLRSHEKTHNSDRQPEHICQLCGKAYFGRHKLKEHIRSKHGEVEEGNVP